MFSVIISVQNLQLYDILHYLIIFISISMTYTVLHLNSCLWVKIYTLSHIQQLSISCKNLGSHDTCDIINGLDT